MAPAAQQLVIINLQLLTKRNGTDRGEVKDNVCMKKEGHTACHSEVRTDKLGVGPSADYSVDQLRIKMLQGDDIMSAPSHTHSVRAGITLKCFGAATG